MDITEIHNNETMTYLPAGGTLMTVVVMKTASLACKCKTAGNSQETNMHMSVSLYYSQVHNPPKILVSQPPFSS